MNHVVYVTLLIDHDELGIRQEPLKKTSCFESDDVLMIREDNDNSEHCRIIFRNDTYSIAMESLPIVHKRVYQVQFPKSETKKEG